MGLLGEGWLGRDWGNEMGMGWLWDKMGQGEDGLQDGYKMQDGLRFL